MNQEPLEIKLLAISKLMNEISVRGENNLALLATAIKEIRNVADQLHENANKKEVMQTE